MPAEELPGWTTEMDIEILNALLSGLVLTPAVIADNIDRSRGAVSRRLNTLDAGGLVEREGRGKYRIAGAAAFQLLEPVAPGEHLEEGARKDIEDEKLIQEELGVSKEEYQDAVLEEYDRLREERGGYWSMSDLMHEAARNVELEFIDAKTAEK